MSLSEDQGRRSLLPGALAFFRDGRLRREAQAIAPYLDAKFYLEQNADVAAAGLDASYHYVKFGWREGRDPSPSFSTRGYLAAHPTVAMSGRNPLLHFIHSGKDGGEGAGRDALLELDLSEELALVETDFDAEFYAAAYPDYAKSGLAPAAHYCRVGWREGKDPSAAFSTGYYLLTNPDIRESGVNPFWHYLIAGKDEGRLPSHPGGWKHQVLSAQGSFEDYCGAWMRDDPLPELLDADALASRLLALREATGLLVSIGHDDYRHTPGGVQLCVEIEARDAAVHDQDYLNIHPWQPLPKLAAMDEDYVVCLVMNGQTAGVARVATVHAALSKMKPVSGPVDMVIHHLAGHAPERISAFATALGTPSPRLWLHDYFTLCTSYALQRNNVTPCNVPKLSSNACGICLFGIERRQQQDRIIALFNALEIEVISPSDVALRFWSERTSLSPAMCRVQPHVRLVQGKRPMAVAEAEAVNIAFIGTPASHKGWPVFLELQRRLAATDQYAFWYLGTHGCDQAEITHVETHVRASDLENTIRAVAENGIDIVLHWASWPETFSFSTYEALAGGAFVVTNAGSGNVAATVEHFRRGVVLGDTDALYELAENGGLIQLAEDARQARLDGRLVAQFSGMTHECPVLEDAV